MKAKLSGQIFENPETQNFMKLCPAELSCSTWMDRQADMTKLIAAFRNFENMLN